MNDNIDFKAIETQQETPPHNNDNGNYNGNNRFRPIMPGAVIYFIVAKSVGAYDYVAFVRDLIWVDIAGNLSWLSTLLLAIVILRILTIVFLAIWRKEFKVFFYCEFGLDVIAAVSLLTMAGNVLTTNISRIVIPILINILWILYFNYSVRIKSMLSYNPKNNIPKSEEEKDFAVGINVSVKEQNKQRKPNFALTIISIIVAAISIVGNIFAFTQISSSNTIISELNSHVSELNAQVTYLKENNDFIKDRLHDANEDLEELSKQQNMAKFFYTHAVIVFQYDNRYHKYGCPEAPNGQYTFWIYNTEAAISMGFLKCPVCHH